MSAIQRFHSNKVSWNRRSLFNVTLFTETLYPFFSLYLIPNPIQPLSIWRCAIPATKILTMFIWTKALAWNDTATAGSFEYIVCIRCRWLKKLKKKVPLFLTRHARTGYGILIPTFRTQCVKVLFLFSFFFFYYSRWTSS